MYLRISTSCLIFRIMVLLVLIHFAPEFGASLGRFSNQINKSQSSIYSNSVPLMSKSSIQHYLFVKAKMLEYLWCLTPYK